MSVLSQTPTFAALPERLRELADEGNSWQQTTKAQFRTALTIAKDRGMHARLLAPWCIPTGVQRTLVKSATTYVELSGPNASGGWTEGSRLDLAGQHTSVQCLTLRADTGNGATIAWKVLWVDMVNTNRPMDQRISFLIYITGPAAWTVEV